MTWFGRHRRMPHDQPRPPWIVSPSISPADDPYWTNPEGRAWLATVFLPFYDGLSTDAQVDYCSHWNAPPGWVTLFLHPDMDEVAADADEADMGIRVEPVNYRRRLLD